jgi:Brp/Blh family beta-carotene 15,15'-monooxygenase
MAPSKNLLRRNSQPGSISKQLTPTLGSLCTFIAFGALWLLAAWSEQRWSAAGLWVMLGLSLSTGLLHGALDALLLLQRFASRARALMMAVLYLAAVIATGALLSGSPTLALFALIAMSAWHFGEPFGRWTGQAPTPTRTHAHRSALAGLTRAVLGAAPVLLLPWTQANLATSALLPWLSADALQIWRGLGLLWLGLFVVWAWTCGLPRWRAYRQAWAELLAILLLNLSLSPLLAFALYFGAYHAPLHIWRVWQAGRAEQVCQAAPLPQITAVATLAAVASVTAVLLLTAGLGVWLWRLPGAELTQTAVAGDALRWLVVALAALTLPHLLLISRCSRWLESASSNNSSSSSSAAEVLRGRELL